MFGLKIVVLHQMTKFNEVKNYLKLSRSVLPDLAHQVTYSALFGGFFLGITMFSTTASSAPELYRWTDDDGNEHFSNEKNNPNALRTILPSIERSDIDKRIEELKQLSGQTCIHHGETDCGKGPDEDGSVICQDGNKDSQERFDSLCKEVRLSSELLIPRRSKKTKQSRLPIRVLVRNGSALTANNVIVSLSMRRSLSSDTRKTITLEGAVTIGPFGIEEYTYTGALIEEKLLRRAYPKAECNECWNPLSTAANQSPSVP